MPILGGSDHDQRLPCADKEGIMRCPESGLRYREVSSGMVRCLDLDEESPLPADLASVSRPHRALREAALQETLR